MLINTLEEYMDKNNRNKSSGRRVISNDYDWNKLDEKVRMEKHAPSFVNTNEKEMAKKSARMRAKKFQQKQKKKRLMIKRVRAAVIMVAAIAAVCVILMMMPIFNIQSITVDGNHNVTLEEIDAQIGNLMGQNLFKISGGTIKKRLKNIASIDDVTVSKRLFPPAVKVTVRECATSGYFRVDGKNIVINSELKVLNDDNSYNIENIPAITGITIEKYSVGKAVTSKESEKLLFLGKCLKAMEATSITENVVTIDVSDITNLKFNYDERIDVLCGSDIDLDRKIRLFKETISSNNLAENAKGTIDLSETGKAVYTP